MTQRTRLLRNTYDIQSNLPLLCETALHSHVGHFTLQLLSYPVTVFTSDSPGCIPSGLVFYIHFFNCSFHFCPKKRITTQVRNASEVRRRARRIGMEWKDKELYLPRNSFLSLSWVGPSPPCRRYCTTNAARKNRFIRGLSLRVDVLHLCRI